MLQLPTPTATHVVVDADDTVARVSGPACLRLAVTEQHSREVRPTAKGGEKKKKENKSVTWGGIDGNKNNNK